MNVPTHAHTHTHLCLNTWSQKRKSICTPTIRFNKFLVHGRCSTSAGSSWPDCTWLCCLCFLLFPFGQLCLKATNLKFEKVFDAASISLPFQFLQFLNVLLDLAKANQNAPKSPGHSACICMSKSKTRNRSRRAL